jgi:C4-dicarboxylate-binding protein DctP
MDIYELTEDDLAAWRAATLPLEDTYVAAAGPLGAQLLEAAKAIRDAAD